MATTTRCPDCGTERSGELPEGLCPGCLLKTDSEEQGGGDAGEFGGGRERAALAAWRLIGCGARCDGDDGEGAAAAEPPNVPRYRVLRLLGAGGMGAVYEAEQVTPRRAVALKVIRAGVTSRRLLRRFREEAEALGRLQHPGIAQIYEFGTTDPAATGLPPQPFFAMELVRGPDGGPAPTLTEYAAAARLSTRQRLELLAQVADAVHYAHQKRIIHRDLKPGNILVAEGGQPKVLDFGVARVTDPAERSATLYTDAGQVVGTVAYMSPEQACGDVAALDTRSDVYALGVLAYELLAGRLPHDVTRLMVHDAVRLIRDEEPSRLGTVDRSLRGDVETIVATAAAKEKERRYQSAAEFAADLRRYLRHEPIVARRAGTWYHASRFARRNRALVGGVAAAFAALAVGIAATTWQAAQASAAREEARLSLRDAYLAQARALRSGTQPGRRFDGVELLRKAASIRNGADLRDEAIACLAQADLRPLSRWNRRGLTAFDPTLERYAVAADDGAITIFEVSDHRPLLSLPPEGAAAPRPSGMHFSPDGRRLVAVEADGRVRVWDLERRAAPPALLPARATDWTTVAFTPDSRSCAVGSGSDVHFCDVEGARPRSVSLGPLPFAQLVFDPAGRRLCVRRARLGGGDTVHVHDAATGEQLAALPHPAAVWGVAWHPDGSRVATGAHDWKARVWQVAAERCELTLSGHQAVVTEVAYAAGGKLLVTSGWDVKTRLWDPATGEELASCESGGNTFRVSADGSRLALQVFSSDEKQREVWEVAAPLVRTLRTDRRPSGGPWGVDFSPDGNLLASASIDGVDLWGLPDGRLVARLKEGPMDTVLFSADGRGLFAYGQQGLEYPVAPEATTARARVGPGRQVFADRYARLTAWSRRGPQFLDPGALHVPEDRRGAAMYEVKVSEDGRWVAATSGPKPREGRQAGVWEGESAIIVWDRASGSLLRTFPAGTRAVIRFSPDSRWFAASSEDECRFWSTEDWELRHRMAHAAADGGGDVAFSADGNLAALAVGRRLVRFIDTRSWRETATLTPPRPQQFTGLAFSPDGAHFAAGSLDHQVLLWDLAAIRRELAAAGLE